MNMKVTFLYHLTVYWQSFFCTVGKVLNFPCAILSLKLHDEILPVGQAQSDIYLPFSHFENVYLPKAVRQPLLSSLGLTLFLFFYCFYAIMK